MFKLKEEFIPLNSMPSTEGKKSNLSNFLKEATQLKKNEGYDSSIIFLENLARNNNYSDEETVRIIKRIIEYKTKVKGNKIDDSLNYLKHFLDDKDIYNKTYIDLHCLYSNLLSQKDQTLGIDYLVQLLKNDFKDYSFIKYYTDLAEKYKNNSNFADALNTYYALQKKLNTDEAFQFQRNYCDLTFETSELYYELKPNNWENEFIKFRILNFVYSIITDIDISSPAGFFYRKNICYKGEWGGDEKFDLVLEQIGKNDGIKEIYNKIFDFTFLELPLIMGLPAQCLDEIGQAEFRKSPEFIKEYMKFKNVIDSNGLTTFNDEGFERLKPFTQLQEIDSCVQKITNEITNK